MESKAVSSGKKGQAGGGGGVVAAEAPSCRCGFVAEASGVLVTCQCCGDKVGTKCCAKKYESSGTIYCNDKDVCYPGSAMWLEKKLPLDEPKKDEDPKKT